MLRVVLDTNVFVSSLLSTQGMSAFVVTGNVLHLVHCTGEVIQPSADIKVSATRLLLLQILGFLVRLYRRSQTGCGRISEIPGKRMNSNCSTNSPIVIIKGMDYFEPTMSNTGSGNPGIF